MKLTTVINHWFHKYRGKMLIHVVSELIVFEKCVQFSHKYFFSRLGDTCHLIIVLYLPIRQVHPVFQTLIWLASNNDHVLGILLNSRKLQIRWSLKPDLVGYSSQNTSSHHRV